MRDKRCKFYCGVACVDGSFPIALYNEDFTLFERKPSCVEFFLEELILEEIGNDEKNEYQGGN